MLHNQTAYKSSLELLKVWHVLPCFFSFLKIFNLLNQLGINVMDPSHSKITIENNTWTQWRA